MNRIPYDPRLVPFARDLRNNSTLPEVVLWKALKKHIPEVDFHRQKPLLTYIVDFFAEEHLLAIELDGKSHRDKADADTERDLQLATAGVRVLRFKNAEVMEQLPTTIDRIRAALGLELQQP